MIKKGLITIISLFTGGVLSYSFFSSEKNLFPWVCLCVSSFFIGLYIFSKMVIFAKKVYAEGFKGELFLSTLYKSSFSIIYLCSVFYWSNYLELNSEESVLVKGGFTQTTFNEVVLLVFLLILSLVSYNKCLEGLRTGNESFIKHTVKAASWLFITYSFLVIKPVASFSTFESIALVFWSPVSFFCSFPAVNIFDVDADSTYLILVKLMFIVLANYQLHLVLKYYKKGYVSHNYFVIILLLLWGNLFSLGVNDVFLLVLVFDIIAMCTAALIVLHEKKENDHHSKLALFYFLISIFTSLGAYYGFFLVSTQYGVTGFRAHYVILESLVPANGLPNGFVLFAWFLVAIKVLFLVGAFPFYKYVIETGTSLSYPAIYYWSVTSKLAVVVFVIKFFHVVRIIDVYYFSTVLSVLFVASVAYASFALYSTPRIKQFFAYSSMINLPVALIVIIANWKPAAFVILVHFFVYAIAMFGLMLFLSSSYKLEMFSNVRADNEIDTFENFLWSSQDMRFSSALNRLPFSKDYLSAVVKIGAGSSALVLMGAAPFAGFFLKYLIVSVFASISSFFICFIILASSALAHLAYFGLFACITEKVCKYTGRSSSEWTLLFEEDDFGYFQFIIFFNFLATMFLTLIIF